MCDTHKPLAWNLKYPLHEIKRARSEVSSYLF